MIESLIDGVDLSESEAESSLDFLLNDANEALISAFLVLLRAKGETYEEVIRISFLIYFSFTYCYNMEYFFLIKICRGNMLCWFN